MLRLDPSNAVLGAYLTLLYLPYFGLMNRSHQRQRLKLTLLLYSAEILLL